ncbi:MAG: endolytic transglycosylase MltG [Candidatus Vogelbacteria bacterium]|nr:endolytic transglycosylase MltG [Candidatus Vogelbacteria bacterium]
MDIKRHVYHRRNIIILVIGFAILAVIYSVYLAPPHDFPETEIMTVKSGQSIRQVGEQLLAGHFITNLEAFIILEKIFGAGHGIIAGGYYFDRPISSLIIAKRLARGEFNLTPIRITFPEGITAREMSRILQKNIPNFDSALFTRLTKNREGYLFPDTYYFSPTITTDEIVEQLEKTFEIKTATLATKALWSRKSFNDIIVMASLLEEEAKTFSDRKMIAGILWKRVAAGMRLQVDAVFPYIIGKNTFQLTKTDLQINSPYNTYRFAGLPAGPISNPGLEAINAALDPTPSPYWFYLTGDDGKMYYSVDFDGHKDNRVNYLD